MLEDVTVGVDELEIDSRIGDGHDPSSVLRVHGTAPRVHRVALEVDVGTQEGAAMATQDEYRAKAREALEKLQQQIDELRVQANLAGAEARDRFDKAIDALRKRQAETRSKLDQAADATGDAWKNAAKQLEEAVDSVGD